MSEKIKQVAKAPVATAYRETDPYVMERILQEGKADLIAGLRYNIADPAFAKKVMEGRKTRLTDAWDAAAAWTTCWGAGCRSITAA